jgi:hypothetical protein
MLSLSDALLGLGLPAFCGAIVFFAMRRARGDALVFAVGAGFLAGYVAINQSSWIPLGEPAHCVFLGAAAMLAVAAIHQFAWPKAWFWNIGSLLILAGVIAGVFSLLGDPEWTAAQKFVCGATLWAASALVAAGLALRFRRAASAESLSDDLLVAIALVIVSGLSAAVVGMSGTQTYGRIAAIIPATLAPIVLLSLLLRTKIVSPCIAALYVVAAGGLLLCTNLFASLTLLNASLLFLSPLGLLADVLPIVRRRTTWQRFAIELVAACLPAAVAFGLALSKFVGDMSGEFGAY